MPLTVLHSTMMPKTAVWLLETALFPPATRPAPRLITGRWFFLCLQLDPSPTARRSVTCASASGPPGGHSLGAARPATSPLSTACHARAKRTKQNGGPSGPPYQVKQRSNRRGTGAGTAGLQQSHPGHHAQGDQTNRCHGGDYAEETDVTKRTSRCAHSAPPPPLRTTLIGAARQPGR